MATLMLSDLSEVARLKERIVDSSSLSGIAVS